MRTLIVGADATGKSTLARGIQRRYSDTIMGSTRSEEVLQFKRNNFTRAIDADFIDERERFFLRVERDELSRLNQLVGDVCVTISSLATRLAHNVMRQCVGAPSLSNEEVIARWLEDEAAVGVRPPDIIVLVHAPIETIRQRIVKRQEAGKQQEEFVGFNALSFLEQYQLGWLQLVDHLQKSGFACVAIDTSEKSIGEVLTEYGKLRR
jgi:thymidylate kinase